MAKSADAFRTISEVAEWLETPAHVLRFWESKFSQVKPVKRAGGRRYYRPADMKLLGGIKKLLHDDGMTIKGVQKLLREQGVGHVAVLSQPLGDAADDEPIEVSVSDALDDRDTASATSAEAPEPAPAKDPQRAPGTSAEETPAAEPSLTFARRSTDESDTAAEEEPAAPEEETTAELPSFYHLRAQANETAEAPEAPMTETIPTQDDAIAPAKPLQVDVPEDPSDHEAAPDGVLNKLSALSRPVSATTAKKLKPLLEKLRETASARQGS